MYLTTSSPRLLIVLSLAVVIGCGEAPTVEPAGTNDLPTIVPLGKEDNFFSQTAQEYAVTGTWTVTLDAADASLTEDEQLQKVRRLIPFKQVVVGWFLNSYIVSKSNKAENKEYGNFHAITKNGSYEELDITPLGDLTWSFTFRQEVGGPLDLIEEMPVEVGANGEHAFDLVVGKISNEDMQNLETNHEWYRKAPWKTFDPSKVDAEKLETLRLTIESQPRSLDAWVDYGRLFVDGRVTIGVHFGWDYHSEYHLKHSRSVYEWLVARGYSSPVASYDDLKRDSGPLTRSIMANGAAVQVEVSLYWGKPGSATDPDTDAGGKQLEQDMIHSLETREVIVYSGHSGPFYGFALGNWRKTSEGDLDDSEIPLLNLPYDTYQIVLAEGCETYALGQAFWSNPAKGDQLNLDILTTNSFSNASTSSAVTDFLGAIAGTGHGDDVHEPKTYGKLLRDLDGNSFWFSTMYGVHGIDDNPHLHPYAEPAGFCQACTSDADCGGSNFCVKLSDGAYCTAACTGDDGCGEGYSCNAVAWGLSITGRACTPTNLSCSAPAPEEPRVMFNEVLADPPPGALGDANGDGVRDAVADEFVELYNPGGETVDLSGWSLSDSVTRRFTFGVGAMLPPGGVAVVFGGGQPQLATESDFVRAYTSEDGLGLNNTGDALVLRTAEGRIADGMTYGHEGGQDRSLVRAVDGDRESGFVVHPGAAPFSPGTTSDGQPF